MRRLIGNLLHLEIHGVRPTESDHILRVAGAYSYLCIPLGDVVFFADRAVGGEPGVNRRGKMLRDSGGIRMEALGVEAGNGNPVCGRPTVWLVPLQAGVRVAG